MPPRARATFSPRAAADPPKSTPAEPAGAEAVTPVAEPHPRAADLFVGRGGELERLAALLFPTSGVRRPVVVSGMAGVGKSYLVDRFYWDHQDKFPGGYLRLSLDPEKLVSASELLAQLADRLELPVGRPRSAADPIDSRAEPSPYGKRG